MMDELRGRESSGVWHHEEVEHHRTRPWGNGTAQYAKGLQDYGRVGERKGEDLQKPDKGERGGRSG